MKKILVVLGVLISVTAFGQDPQFSQYYQSPTYLNPGFTGITPQQRLVLNHRLQWPNLPQAYATYAASYDIFVEELRSGFGIQFMSDRMGSAGWSTTAVNMLYSYKVKLTQGLVFSPGLSFGYGTNGIDRNKLKLGDGLEYDGISIDPDVFKLGRQSYFDFASGFLMYTKSFWFGAAFSHMNEPNLSVLGEESRLEMKSTYHAGFRWTIKNNRRNQGKNDYLTPSLIYRTQGASFKQFDIGLNYHIDPVSVGIWYRGKPWSKSVINSSERDALILYLGMYLKQLTVGYSYDFTISELQTASGGAHEISIVYEFNSKPGRRSDKKKYKLIPCPTFNSREGFWN